MQAFFCDRRVKWRTTSSSLTSGSGRSRRRNRSGRTCSTATVGTSAGGIVAAWRPGELRSKISGSGIGPPVSSCSDCPLFGDHLTQKLDQAVHISTTIHLGRAQEKGVRELRVVTAQLIPADNPCLLQASINCRGRDRAPHCKLVEEGPGEGETKSGHRRHPIGQIVGILQAQLGHCPEAVPPHIGEVDRRRKRAERLDRKSVV